MNAVRLITLVGFYEVLLDTGGTLPLKGSVFQSMGSGSARETWRPTTRDSACFFSVVM